jgi:hypothetical protein
VKAWLQAHPRFHMHFTPAEESFVLLTLNGKRLGATLRVDAPADDAQTLVT